MKGRIALIVLAAFAIGALLCRNGWVRLPNTRVTSNGAVVSSARVFRNLHGDLLIDLRQEPGEIFLIRDGEVGIPNPSSVLELPFLAISKNAPLQSGNLESAKADSVDPHLSVGDRELHFLIYDGNAIDVTGQ